MSAITLNLLVDEQLAQHEKSRDPVKLCLAIGLGVSALAAGVGAVASVWANQAKAETAALQAEWDRLAGAGGAENDFQTIKRLADDMVACSHNRRLLAPHVALIKDLVPASVKLDQFDLMIEVENVASGGEEGTGEKAPPPKRVERLVIRLTGQATASRPELEVDKFLQTLRTDARLRDSVGDVQLLSIGRLRLDGADGAPTSAASFVIECRGKEAR